MTTLYVHIGMEKTGTTSLQSFFNRNREVLLEHGVAYPDFGKKYPHVSTNVNGYWLTANETDGDFRTECFDKVNQLAGKCDSILVSAECLWYEGAHSKEFWEELRQRVDAQIQIRALAYVRRQDRFVYSDWSQSVKAQKHRFTCTFQEYVSDQLYGRKFLDYREYFELIGSAIGYENIVVGIYEPQYFEGGSIFADFLGLMGVEMDESFQQLKNRQNITIRGSVLEAKRLMNGFPELEGIEEGIRPYLVKAQEALEKKGDLEEKLDFTSQERLEFLESYRESNEWVARTLLGRDDGVLFREPVETDQAQRTSYSNEEIAEACGHIIMPVMEKNRKLEEKAKRLEDVEGELRKTRADLEKAREELDRAKAKNKELEARNDNLRHPFRYAAKKVLGRS